jgi:sporulation protein YlmC with PRC-barrel domain
MQISDQQFRGRTIITADGQAIGEVGAMVIDTSTWSIVTIQIKLNKAAAEQVGAARGILHAATLDLSVQAVQSVGDAVVLSVPTAELRQILHPAEDKHQAAT